MNGREAALKALTACRKRGAWSADAISGQIPGDAEPREAALAVRLLYGVFQNLTLLDFYIGHYSTVRPEKMEPRVLDILRISTYQLLFMDRIPVSAAVNEAVELTKKYSNVRAAGLVNAVLRRISKSTETLPQPCGSASARFSVLYSTPVWLVNQFISLLGEDGAEALLRENNADTPTMLRANLLKTSPAGLERSLEADGAEFSPHPWLEGSYLLKGSVERLSAFKNGSAYVQDAAGVLAVIASGASNGMSVLDGCSAPGGKSFAAAIQMRGEGRICACDIHENKLKRIREGAERLGIGIISARRMDAGTPDAELFEAFDVVIADVPCSGLGVIRKKPEIRYKPESELRELPKIQLRALEGLSYCVRPGGTLIYSTCTVLPRENGDVIAEFLQKKPEFTAEDFILPAPVGASTGGMITLWPHIHGTDGFFICKMRKKT